MTASGRLGMAFSPAIRAMVGRPKARVLPEPVWPRPSTSCPERMSGIVARWMGNGLVMPWRARPATSGLGNPSRAKSTGSATVGAEVSGAAAAATGLETGAAPLAASVLVWVAEPVASGADEE